MDLIQVNQPTCKKCGTCAATCPRGLIAFQPNDFPEPAAQTALPCTKCGHCVAVCPTGSLTHRDVPVEKCPPVQEALELTAEQCEQLLRSRRSIRVYKNQPVAREVIVRLIEIARYAPTGHNRQEVEWLVIDNREDLNRLEGIALDWMRWVVSNQAPKGKPSDMERMLQWAEKVKNLFLRSAPALVLTHAAKDLPVAPADCTIALTFLDLAAQSMGLGCCWAGLVSRAANIFTPMKEALSLPEDHIVYGAMVFGYPKFRFPRIPFRRPAQITWYRP